MEQPLTDQTDHPPTALTPPATVPPLVSVEPAAVPDHPPTGFESRDGAARPQPAHPPGHRKPTGMTTTLGRVLTRVRRNSDLPNHRPNWRPQGLTRGPEWAACVPQCFTVPSVYRYHRMGRLPCCNSCRWAICQVEHPLLQRVRGSRSVLSGSSPIGRARDTDPGSGSKRLEAGVRWHRHPGGSSHDRG